ncbi:MAG: VTT domain-containing protein [Bacteroidota bacterium]|nr:VTT domain-containing protein [Bacteroidota bacterium]
MDKFDWLQLINPEFYINMSIGGVKIGLWVVLFIVFAETGLFVGFFLPGDSLLFLSGVYSTELVSQFITVQGDFLNVLILSSLVALAGILGNMVGYWFGAKSGTYLYRREDSFLFKKKYLIQSKDFFEKHGGRAIIFARFFPIFRTFAPIVAGISGMNKQRFMLFNVVSSIIWAFSLIFAGHYLNDLFGRTFGIELKDNIGFIVITLVVITTFPVIIKLVRKPKDNQ